MRSLALLLTRPERRGAARRRPGPRYSQRRAIRISLTALVVACSLVHLPHSAKVFLPSLLCTLLVYTHSARARKNERAGEKQRNFVIAFFGKRERERDRERERESGPRPSEIRLFENDCRFVSRIALINNCNNEQLIYG